MKTHVVVEGEALITLHPHPGPPPLPATHMLRQSHNVQWKLQMYCVFTVFFDFVDYEIAFLLCFY